MVYHTKGDISSALSSIGSRRATSSLIGKTLSISSQALVISSSGRLPPLLARIGRLATTLLSHGWLINIPKLDNYQRGPHGLYGPQPCSRPVSRPPGLFLRGFLVVFPFPHLEFLFFPVFLIFTIVQESERVCIMGYYSGQPYAPMVFF